MKNRNKPFVVGITGGSGSGKTYFINQLKQQFQPESISLISQDHYYKPIGKQPKDEKGIENFDTPQSIDLEHYEKDLQSLIEGKKIKKEEYNFNYRDLKPGIITITPAPIILAEGIFSLYLSSLRAIYDYKIFIQADEEVKLKRRIRRDEIERGYDKEDVIYRYRHHVAPAFSKYIEPQKEEADLVIINNKSFEKELSLVTSYLKSKI